VRTEGCRRGDDEPGRRWVMDGVLVRQVGVRTAGVCATAGAATTRTQENQKAHRINIMDGQQIRRHVGTGRCVPGSDRSRRTRYVVSRNHEYRHLGRAGIRMSEPRPTARGLPSAINWTTRVRRTACQPPTTRRQLLTGGSVWAGAGRSAGAAPVSLPGVEAVTWSPPSSIGDYKRGSTNGIR
jgi:hypothetical protein